MTPHVFGTRLQVWPVISVFQSSQSRVCLDMQPSVTQGYVHLDTALVVAADRVSAEIAHFLMVLQQ